MRFTALLIAAFAALAVANPIAEPQASNDTPDPSQVYIESIEWNGSGCKMGPNADTKSIFSADRKVVQLLFSEFSASRGPGVAITQSRKQCQINFKIHYPKNWQYTISRTVFRGYAQIGQTCKAYLRATYYFSGETAQAVSTINMDGNTPAGNYVRSDTVVAIWPKCSIPALFNVNSEAVILSCAKDDSALLSVDSADHSYRQEIHIQWRRCS